jgi:acetyltransferase-like isoleucine patch superfamily enzyme
MILIEKCFSYLYYICARYAPVNKIRIVCLRKIRYIQIGKDCFIGPGITLTPLGGEYFEHTINKADKLLRLGDRVGIGPNVSFICSSLPKKSWKLSKIYGKIAPIIIDDDVWIGAGVIFLPGITVHQCSVVGAGSVVTKDVPPYTVVAGVPARPIKTLARCE